MASSSSPPPPASTDKNARLFDSSHPFKGIVVCCTSIPPEQRTDIASKTVELGGTHKYDLTPDVTHLIVGEYDTPKYRHVAKERPDIRPMSAAWIEAVRDLWVKDADIDLDQLEATWRLKTFETAGANPDGSAADTTHGPRLLCCLTGFDDPDERQRLIDMAITNGAAYTGDLTRKVTHLIVAKPEGRKYAAAKNWGLYTVSVEWLYDSVERQMILDEKAYDPILPNHERGKGAWARRELELVSLGKRLRDGAAARDEGKRKLRKTASMKLTSQRDTLWGDILGRQPSTEQSMPPTAQLASDMNPHEPVPAAPSLNPCGPVHPVPRDSSVDLAIPVHGAIFNSCYFFIHGFSRPRQQILTDTVLSLDGQVGPLGNDVASVAWPSLEQMKFRILIVPQDSHPDTHPPVPENVDVVTEFFVERCLHKRSFFHPGAHVIGRPFPRFPISGFSKLSICTAGFTGVDLNQVYKSIGQIGAQFEERFTPQCSVLVCTSIQVVRQQKLELSAAWKIPVVSAAWLWECIASGCRLPFDGFLATVSGLKNPLRPLLRTASEPVTGKQTSRALQISARIRGPGTMGNVHGAPLSRNASASVCGFLKDDADSTNCFETAPTHQAPISGEGDQPATDPLVKASSNVLNKSPSPEKQVTPAADLGACTDNSPGILLADADEPVAESRVSHDRAAVDRLALTAKFTSLFEATAPALTVAPDGTAPREEAAPGPRRERRKREIFGRAISNASVGSAGSADAAGESGSTTAKPHSAAASFATNLFGEPSEETDVKKPPAATQIEYEDPEAKQLKAQLMKKIMGTTGHVSGPASVAAMTEEKVTIGELEAAARAAGDASRIGGRRTRRR